MSPDGTPIIIIMLKPGDTALPRGIHRSTQLREDQLEIELLVTCSCDTFDLGRVKKQKVEKGEIKNGLCKMIKIIKTIELTDPA